MRGCALAAAIGLLAWTTVIGEASAADYRLTGVGTASAGNPFGTSGEQVTISIDLSSDDFVFAPVGSQSFRFFDPTKTVPVSVVGAISGVYPNVEPVEELLAFSSGSTQFLDIDVRFGGTNTTLFRSNCNTTGCFDITTQPADAAEFLGLLAASVNDATSWTPFGTSNFFAGSDDTYLVSSIDWSIEDLNAPPTETVAIAPTFDAQLRPGNDFPIGDADNVTIEIDGGSGSAFPRLDALMEFPLDAAPADASIVSATLQIDPQISNPITIEALGYAGDGIAALGDEDASTQLLGSGVVSSTDLLSIELDAGFVESLLGTATHLGVRLASSTAGPFNRIASSESGVGQGPQLLIEYATDGLPGDFNGDGTVDAADYTVWRDNASGDFTPQQYTTWADNYGATTSPPASTVPEPTAVVLLAAGLVFARPRRV